MWCILICKGPTSFWKYEPVVNIRSRSHLLIWNSETTQNLSIYLYNYQRETAISLATKHEKTVMACSFLNFYIYFLYFELLVSNTITNESIHLNLWHHNHYKDSLKTQVVLLIFSLELEISGVTVQRRHQNSKKW